MATETAALVPGQWQLLQATFTQPGRLGMEIGPSPIGLTVVARVPLGQASSNNVQLGDVICNVQGQDVRAMNYDDVKRLPALAERPLTMTFGRPHDMEGCEAAYGPLTEAGPVLHSGWVQKYSTTGTHREQLGMLQRLAKKRRWLSLTDSDISYRAQQRDPAPLRSLPLATVCEVTVNGNELSILSLAKDVNERVEMRCVCPSAEEAAEWEAAINGASAPSSSTLWAAARNMGRPTPSNTNRPAGREVVVVLEQKGKIGVAFSEGHVVDEMAAGPVLNAGGVMIGDTLLRVGGESVEGQSAHWVKTKIRDAERPLELVFWSAAGGGTFGGFEMDEGARAALRSAQS